MLPFWKGTISIQSFDIADFPSGKRDTILNGVCIGYKLTQQLKEQTVNYNVLCGKELSGFAT